MNNNNNIQYDRNEQHKKNIDHYLKDQSRSQPKF